MIKHEFSRSICIDFDDRFTDRSRTSNSSKNVGHNSLLLNFILNLSIHQNWFRQVRGSQTKPKPLHFWNHCRNEGGNLESQIIPVTLLWPWVFFPLWPQMTFNDLLIIRYNLYHSKWSSTKLPWICRLGSQRVWNWPWTICWSWTSRIRFWNDQNFYHYDWW